MGIYKNGRFSVFLCQFLRSHFSKYIDKIFLEYQNLDHWELSKKAGDKYFFEQGFIIRFFSWLSTFYMYFEVVDTLVVSDLVKKFILAGKIS